VSIAYVTSQDGYAYAVNTATGAQVWKSASPLGTTLQGGAAVWIQALQPRTFTGGVTSDVVFVGTSNTGNPTTNQIYARNGNTGASVWTFSPGNMDIIASTPYVDFINNTVWVTSRSNAGTQPSVWKLNALTGALASGTATWALGDIDSSPVPSADGAFLYVGTNLGALKAIRLSDGTVFTHTPASTAPCNCTGAGALKGMPWSLWYDAAGSGGETIIFTRNATVHSVNFNGSTFSANWTTTLAGAPTVSAPVDDGAGNLYIGASDGKVHRLLVSNGNDAGQAPATAISGTFGDPTFNYDLNKIHVGGTDGHIYTFATGF
jgi:hypothetical protein